MRRYLAIATAAALLAVAATATLAWLVDPYAYWSTPEIDGLNRFRPSSGKHLAAVKQRQYARLKPATLIAGNSRVDVGIDPGTGAWPEAMRPVYNLGLPGKGAAAVADEVERALDTHRPRSVFIGLDFLDFRLSEDEWRRPAHGAAPRSQSLAEQAALTAKLLFSLDALTDSVGSLIVQRQQFPADITRQGFNGLGEYNAIVAAEGHSALFAQRNRENLNAYANGPKQVRWGAGEHPDFQVLAHLARRMKDEGVVLTLFTYPYHADLLMSFEATGLRPAYEQWVRDLAEFGERSGVPVFMFTRIDMATTERVPPPGDRKTKMHWYWEGGHFKAALGDKMIGRMARDDVHFQLTPAAVEAYLADMRKALARHRAQNPNDVLRLESARVTAMANEGVPSKP